MSKPTAPSADFQPPANVPPTYNQAISEGAMPQPQPQPQPQPPPGPADYKSPQQPGSYGGYGPSPGGAGYGAPPPGAGYPQYGPGPGMPPQQPQQQYPQYGAGPGMPPQQQQYGQYGAPPGLPINAAAPAAVIQTVPYTGPDPTHMMCPHCHAEIDTSVRSSPSTTAWVSGLLIALFGCWMGCCLIPCCMDECMDKEHYCPNCQAFVGRYRR